ITRTTVGYPIGHFFGYKTNGIFQTEEDVLAYTNADGDPLQPDAAPGDFRWVDVNGDGQINEDDRTFIGDPTPSWTYGGTANVSWRNFELTLFAQGVAGNQIYNATRRFDLPAANYRADALGRWTGPGSTNEYPRLIKTDPNRNFSRSSDFHVEPGAYFRIKTLQLAWNLPAETARHLGMQRAKVYVMANNLYTITKYTGFDPEIGASFGVDRGIYPQPRSYMAGINVTF
ncbi:MAG: SusC/RagA family TonB-linked outer membrane protein, partial [Bacteroidetes bacterium]